MNPVRRGFGWGLIGVGVLATATLQRFEKLVEIDHFESIRKKEMESIRKK